jgi:hypothetical protein
MTWDNIEFLFNNQYVEITADKLKFTLSDKLMQSLSCVELTKYSESTLLSKQQWA